MTLHSSGLFFVGTSTKRCHHTLRMCYQNGLHALLKSFRVGETGPGSLDGENGRRDCTGGFVDDTGSALTEDAHWFAFGRSDGETSVWVL